MYLTGYMQNKQWSPDGKTAVLRIAHPHRGRRRQAGARQVDVIGSTTDEQLLAIIDVVSGAVRQNHVGQSAHFIQLFSGFAVPMTRLYSEYNWLTVVVGWK